MPGAGSLRALEHLEKHAPKDGTVIALFDYTQITNSLLTPDKVPIDFRKFKWIGSVAQDLAVCYVWHTVNAKTVADMQQPAGDQYGPHQSRHLFRHPAEDAAQAVQGQRAFGRRLSRQRGRLHRGRARRARRRLHDLGEPAAAWIADHKITPDHAHHVGDRARSAGERAECLRSPRGTTATARSCACSRPPAKSASRWSRRSRCPTSAWKSCAPLSPRW